MAIKTERVTLRLGPELLEATEQAAYNQEMALGEFIRYALAEYLRLQKEDSA
jgi:predicted DNA binding CopG/RHH family protein